MACVDGEVDPDPDCRLFEWKALKKYLIKVTLFCLFGDFYGKLLG